MPQRHPSWSRPSRSPAERAWPWCVGSSASCSGCWRSCAPSSVARGLSATPRQALSRSRAHPRFRERTVGDRDLRRCCQAATLQIEQQITPRLGALTQAICEADEFLLAFRRRADDDQDTLRLFLEPGLQMDAVGPAINVALS